LVGWRDAHYHQVSLPLTNATNSMMPQDPEPDCRREKGEGQAGQT